MRTANTARSRPQLTELISRRDAKASGLRRYFTGDPCCRGHRAERLVSDYSCVACARAKESKIRKLGLRKEYARLYAREWRERNAERSREINRKCYAKNAENIREAVRLRRAQNPEGHRSVLRKSYRKNKARRSSDAKTYRASNPERISALKRSYKASKRAAGGRFSLEDIVALFKAQSGACAACACDISDRYHVDHVMPLSRGGTNWPDNLQLLCPTCNLSKGQKPMSEWLAARCLEPTGN